MKFPYIGKAFELSCAWSEAVKFTVILRNRTFYGIAVNYFVYVSLGCFFDRKFIELFNKAARCVLFDWPGWLGRMNTFYKLT